MTAPLRTLMDTATSPASWPALKSAVRDALRRGLARRRQLLDAVLPADTHARLMAVVNTTEAAEAPDVTLRGMLGG